MNETIVIQQSKKEDKNPERSSLRKKVHLSCTWKSSCTTALSHNSFWRLVSVSAEQRQPCREIVAGGKMFHKKMLLLTIVNHLIKCVKYIIQSCNYHFIYNWFIILLLHLDFTQKPVHTPQSSVLSPQSYFSVHTSHPAFFGTTSLVCFF